MKHLIFVSLFAASLIAHAEKVCTNQGVELNYEVTDSMIKMTTTKPKENPTDFVLNYINKIDVSKDQNTLDGISNMFQETVINGFLYQKDVNSTESAFIGKTITNSKVFVMFSSEYVVGGSSKNCNQTTK